ETDLANSTSSTYKKRELNLTGSELQRQFPKKHANAIKQSRNFMKDLSESKSNKLFGKHFVNVCNSPPIRKSLFVQLNSQNPSKISQYLNTITLTSRERTREDPWQGSLKYDNTDSRERTREDPWQGSLKYDNTHSRERTREDPWQGSLKYDNTQNRIKGYFKKSSNTRRLTEKREKTVKEKTISSNKLDISEIPNSKYPKISLSRRPMIVQHFYDMSNDTRIPQMSSSSYVTSKQTTTTAVPEKSLKQPNLGTRKKKKKKNARTAIVT
uniref:EXPH5 n=2 Tax=Loa loa TaxID=7209 RepID=A0A1I7VCM4_LOALO